MATVTIAGETILDGEWKGPGLLEYRVFSSQDWVSASGVVHEMGSPYDLMYIDRVLAKGDCVVANRSVTLPDIVLETTVDAQVNPRVTLILALFDKSTNRPALILIPHFTVTSSDNSLDDLMA